MARRYNRDWILGMAEIRAIMPHWPEQLVQDYFARGNFETDFSLKHKFMGPENTDTCRDVEPQNGDVPIFDKETGLWCPGPISSEVDDDCFCFIVPEQDCETLEADCEALDKFILENGTGAVTYYLSRNYETDLIGGINGSLASVIGADGEPIGPDGDISSADVNTAPANIGLDTCGEQVLIFSGGFSGTELIVRDVGTANDMSMSMLMLTQNPASSGVRTIFTGRASDNGTAGYSIGWNPSTGFMNCTVGNTGTGDRATARITGPQGFNDSGEEAWVALALRVVRTSSSMTLYVQWVDSFGEGSAFDTVTQTEDGDSLSSRPWWTLDNSEDNRFVWGFASGADAARIVQLFTGLHQTMPSINYLARLRYELLRNSTDYDCERDGLPPILGGGAPIFDQETGGWVFQSPYPVATKEGQFLASTPGVGRGAQWRDLPTVGGTTGQQLVKASDADNDLEWVQRDSKTFEGSADPSVLETVYPGDLWVQGGIG